MDIRNLNDLDFRLTEEDLVGLPQRVLDRLALECQTNLRFLANCVMRPLAPKFIGLSEPVHGQIIDKLGVNPRPDVSFDQWSPLKEGVTLASRGMLKSTLVAAFIVQLQLCDPDIRILILSGTLPKAKSIMETARTPFATNGVLRRLFPGWAVALKEITGDTFTSPMRNPDLNLREETISIATFDSVKAGGHYEFQIFDDCTNEVNCRTPELVEKCIDNYDDTDPLVEPWGYRRLFATRWADDLSDLPEVIRRRGEAHLEEEGEQNTSYCFIPAWVVRQGTTEQEAKEIAERDRKNELTPEDVILAWPEKLSAKVLWPMYRNPKKVVKFLKQYLLRYVSTMTSESFSRDLLVRSTVPFASGIPMAHDRIAVVNWDLGGIYSGARDKKQVDFSCGLAAMFELSTKRMFLYDAWLEVFMSSTDAANAIVAFYARQLRMEPIRFCDLEDGYGARHLQGEIERIAKVAQVPITLRFQPRSLVKGAKAIRISRLAGAMKRGLVQLATNIPQREIIWNQFEKWSPLFTGKDDGPDCAAQLWEHYSDNIYPGMVQGLQCSDHPSLYPPEAIPDRAPDPHADELEYADIELLSRMTAPHA